MSDIMTIKFITAASNGDLEDLEFCLSLGSVDINAQNNKGSTALIEAANNQHLHIITRLLSETSLDPNIKGPFEKSALSIAVQKSYPKIVSALLKHPSIDVNTVDKFQTSALMKSLRNNEIFALLMRHKGINVNYQKKDGSSALMQAVNFGLVQVVKEFLRRGDVDVNLKNNKEESAEDIAKKKKKKEIVKVFEEYHKRKIGGRGASRVASRNKRFREYTSTLTRGSSFLSNIEVIDEEQDEKEKTATQAMRGMIAMKNKGSFNSSFGTSSQENFWVKEVEKDI
eukprot:snap_masked-scaffold_23-processed-gene-1.16-mRNA-1 protein AED:1.00 eAED:1.00 QI:0/-1/0/0/-1/1/1/0/283